MISSESQITHRTVYVNIAAISWCPSCFVVVISFFSGNLAGWSCFLCSFETAVVFHYNSAEHTMLFSQGNSIIALI